MSDKHQCPDCHVWVVKVEAHRATCTAGVCDRCGHFLRDRRAHVCPIDRFEADIDDAALDEYVERNQRTCDECSTEYVLARSSFRDWRGRSLCVSCYERTGCPDEVARGWTRVIDWQLAQGRTCCADCALPLLLSTTTTTTTNVPEADPITRAAEAADPTRTRGQRLAPYEFDHRHFWDKTDNISTMVRRGETWEVVEQELGRCQLLCLPCHARVTAAEVLCGMTGLKTLVTRADKEPRSCRKRLDRWQTELRQAYPERIRTLSHRLQEALERRRARRRRSALPA